MTYGIVCAIFKPQRENRNTNCGRYKPRQNKIAYRLVCRTNEKENEKRIISVAEYVRDNEVRKVVLRSDHIRHRTLEKCYSIPGYTELPRKVKNAVYDNVKLTLEKAITNKCTTERLSHL